MKNCEHFMLDLSSSVEVVMETTTLNSSKTYISGKQLCDMNYDYLLVLNNPSQLFPSLTVLHLVDLVSKDAVLPPYEIPPSVQENSNTSNKGWHFLSKNPSTSAKSDKTHDEDREAKIVDLLNFVQEISKSEDLIKDSRAKRLGAKFNNITSIPASISEQSTENETSLPSVRIQSGP